MKYKILVSDILEDIIDLPDGAIVAGVTPNFKTNKWMIIYLAPIVEEPKAKGAEEKSGS